MQKYQITTQILHGEGSVDNLGDCLSDLNTNKVLLVTGPSLKKQGIADRVARIIKSANKDVEVFSEVEPEPSSLTIGKGAQIARDLKADLIIGLGGGSNMDAAKAIAAVTTNGGQATDLDGVSHFTKDPLPVIELPTTAGTASEVTTVAVITDTEKHRKFRIASSQLSPKVAILDPTLCTTAPKNVVIAAGMDALTHAIESFTSKRATHFTKANSLYAIKLIHENLRDTVGNPKEIQPMENMLMASCIAGLAFSNCLLGIVHAIALPVGARFGVPHGMANAILLPYGMQFNAAKVPEAYVGVAAAFGVDVSDETPSNAARSAVEMVEILRQDIGCPQTLSEVGVKSEAFGEMAEDAMLSGHVQVNPRSFTAEDVVSVYESAL